MSTYRSFREIPNPGGRQQGVTPGRAPPPGSPQPPRPVGQQGGGFNWDLYLKTGYFQEDDQIRPELLTQNAEALARELNRVGVTSSQFRRFLNKAAAFKRDLENKAPWTQVVSGLFTLQPDAALAAGKQQSMESFKLMIDKNIPLATRGEGAFTKGFMPHLTSVYQYFVWVTRGK